MDENKNYSLLQAYNEIDSLNDQAFVFCVDCLFESMGYKYLEKKDIRRIDLKEWITSSFIWTGKYFTDPCCLYIQVLRERLNQIICTHGSRASDYKKHAITIATMPGIATDDIKDIFQIYNALTRESRLSSDITLANISLNYLLEDSELYNYKSFPIAKQILGSNKKRKKDDLIYKIADDGLYTVEQASIIIFFYDILFLTLGLQDYGML